MTVFTESNPAIGSLYAIFSYFVVAEGALTARLFRGRLDFFVNFSVIVAGKSRATGYAVCVLAV